MRKYIHEAKNYTYLLSLKNKLVLFIFRRFTVVASSKKKK